MSLTPPSSTKAQRVCVLLETLQGRFADGLDRLSRAHGDGATLQPASWLRDGGRHGGGHRREATETGLLNRASLNISSIHYDDLPEKRLSSATALSCIVHPAHPRAPSMHMHISWTELRGGQGGWRVMGDLNPSIPVEADRERFLQAFARGLTGAPEGTLEAAVAQGDRYFAIPALDRHRGIAHAYLEQWNSGDAEADEALAVRFGEEVIDAYLAIVDDALADGRPPTDEERAAQLRYHSLYLLQVLTLDRGTSSGLLIHNQNDVGILGSLPNRVDRDQLASWISKLPSPQDTLLAALVEALPEGSPSVLTPEVRLALAQVVRSHYQRHPEALALQARGDVLPPTVANHGDRDGAT
ncbi:MAG: coproporphyrinogen III oxidase [Myxococcales bacterium]|nr:coproporphyrinogen III oxidase [Myxococcales bacterium]